MEIREAFDKIFGDMSLSENDVAFQVFEYGYKAGVAAENEACAKVCENIVSNYGYVQSKWCAKEIRQRGKE